MKQNNPKREPMMIKLAIMKLGKVMVWEEELKVSEKWINQVGPIVLVYLKKVVTELYKKRSKQSL